MDANDGKLMKEEKKRGEEMKEKIELSPKKIKTINPSNMFIWMQHADMNDRTLLIFII